MKRIQSPSSINLYKQCPRKYYYQYIQRLKTLPSIHLIRGSIAHSVLEDFFALDISKFSKESFHFEMKAVLIESLRKYWEDNDKELKALHLGEQLLRFYKKETSLMLQNFSDMFMQKMSDQMKTCSFEEAFKKLSPKCEIEYRSEKHGVRGFIDAIHDIEGQVTLMDYKTSKKPVISPAYKLQLAIYALLYEEAHGKLPYKVGINFLKFGEQLIDVDEELVKLAREECELIHLNTESTKIMDYPKNITPLCKWSSGQCDFYGICFEQKTLEAYKEEIGCR